MVGEVIVVATVLTYLTYKYVRRTIHHRKRLNFNSPDEVLRLSGPARHYELPEPQFERIPPNALTAQAAKNFPDEELPGASWFGAIVHQRRVVVRLQSEPVPQFDPLDDPIYWDAMWMWTALNNVSQLPRCVIGQDSLQDSEAIVRALSTSFVLDGLGDGEMITVTTEGAALFSMSAYEHHNVGRRSEMLCEVANRLERATTDGRVDLRRLLADAFEIETNANVRAQFYEELWRLETRDRSGPTWNDEREQFFVRLEVEASQNSAAPVQIAHAILTGDDDKLARFLKSPETEPALRIKALKTLVEHRAPQLEDATQSILQTENNGLLLAVALANVAYDNPPQAVEWLRPPASDLREDCAESMLIIIRRAPEDAEAAHPILLALAEHRSDQVSVDAIAIVGRRANTALIKELKKLRFDNAKREHAVEVAVAEFEGKRKDAVGGLSVMEPKSQGSLSIDPGTAGSLTEVDQER